MDHPLQLEGLKVARRVVLQMQDDLGAARHAARLLLGGPRHLEARAARRRPHPGLRRAGARAGHGDAVGHHEGRIEADAELTDQAEPVLGLLQALEEGLGARARHGAEIVYKLLAVHADAGVGDAERLGDRIRLEANLELLGTDQQPRIGDRLVAQLVQGVRRVGDQLAQEHVGLGIDRVDHQAQKLGDLRLELVRLRAACVFVHPFPSIVRGPPIAPERRAAKAAAAAKRTGAPAPLRAGGAGVAVVRRIRPAGTSEGPAAGVVNRRFASSRPPWSNMPRQMREPARGASWRSIWERSGKFQEVGPAR